MKKEDLNGHKQRWDICIQVLDLFKSSSIISFSTIILINHSFIELPSIYPNLSKIYTCKTLYIWATIIYGIELIIYPAVSYTNTQDEWVYDCISHRMDLASMVYDHL